jgi:small-conductance mechanosensitive channel
MISKAQGKQIFSIIRSETHVLDLSLMLILAFFSETIGKILYQRVFRRFRKDVVYDDSITRQVTETVGQAANLGLVCYFFDAVEIVLEVTGIKGKKDYSTLIAKLLYMTWFALRVRLYKRQFFEATFSGLNKFGPKVKGKESKVEIFDKISDFFLFGILSLVWIDILKIKRGNGLSSIFALGGAGTLAFTLACQDLAKKAINGLAISTSEVFVVGDQIKLGDGTSGTVTSIGWLSTEIRGKQ